MDRFLTAEVVMKADYPADAGSGWIRRFILDRASCCTNRRAMPKSASTRPMKTF
jgi:hypothetical protein